MAPMNRLRAGGRAAAILVSLLALMLSSVPATAHNGGRGREGPHTGSSCTPKQTRHALALEQRRVLKLVGEFWILRDQDDLERLAVPDPETGAEYSALAHMFASMGGNGFTVVNIAGGLGSLTPGQPTLLNYRPSRHADDVTDPFGPDFPYVLAGWAYGSPYVPGQPPAFTGDPGLRCLRKAQWFVHERGVHPADTWQFIPVPPEEDFHGQVAGDVPPTAEECQCEVGIPHIRFWDIHLWLGSWTPTVSMLNPGRPIPGFDPLPGVGFFFPETGPAG